jgi:thioredoxin reductase
MVVLEREDVGGTVRHYPRKKLVMTEPVVVPGFGKISAKEILKEELIGIWEEVVDTTGLEVKTGVTVTDVQALPDGGFRVVCGGGEYLATRVILAIGRRGIPRKLGVPGENLPNVAYSLREPEAFAGDRIVVAGGGDSAVEASLALAAQQGTQVRLVCRGESFSRAKPKNRERMDRASREGRISVLWSTQVSENRMDQILLQGPDGQERFIPNNRLFVFTGGELPTPFLERCGIQIDTKFGDP